jgi:uncharacterized protein YjbI with pentapeptide repeats
MSNISQFWKLDRTGRRSLENTLGPIKTITDFLSDVIDSTKDNEAIKDFATIICDAVPWGAVLGAAAEAVTPVKFAVKLFEKLTEVTDPQSLGYLAATMAYERSVEQALTTADLCIEKRRLKSEILRDLESMGTDADFDFALFNFKDALSHRFVVDADRRLEAFLKGLGCDDLSCRRLIARVHQLFVINIKIIVSDGKTAEKFKPFLKLAQIGPGENQFFQSLDDHIAYQLWRFQEAPVFASEHFSLADIYVPTECGLLNWGQIRDGEPQRGRIDAFAEEHGGRRDLLASVMDHIRNPDFKEAIVVQGVAGSGKSSFTYALFAQLVREEYRPIRVQIRDLRLDQDISEALPHSIAIGGPGYGAEPRFGKPENVLGKSDAFSETFSKDGKQVSAFVLILDGWDEVSIAVSQGFGDRIANMLEQVRNQYLKRTVPIRVVLTGRPSDAMTNSKFMRAETPVLTIRPLNPVHLEQYVGALMQVFDQTANGSEASSKLLPLAPIFDAYNEGFEQLMEAARQRATRQGTRQAVNQIPRNMEVLGLPLLAHLTVRLLRSGQGQNPPVNMEELVSNPTILYQKLVDLTCGGSGQVADLAPDVDAVYRFPGRRLRKLLQHTAEAMMVFGRENIPVDELELRLEDDIPNLFDVAEAAQRENVLTKLMVGFFFTGGHRDLGCEFMHKSFKEYLFAERIVQVIKEFGQECDDESPPSRLSNQYWVDFPESDRRHKFCRRLGRMLSPVWITPEVAIHLENLLKWEVRRSIPTEPAIQGNSPNANLPTDPIPPAKWLRIRDALADAWGWWAEAVHLRPQVRAERGKVIGHNDVAVLDWVEWAMPLSYKKGDVLPAPPRITSLDARLGDGLFRICALVHFHVAWRDGWLKMHSVGKPGSWAVLLWSARQSGTRWYQTTVKRGETSWQLFKPDDDDEQVYFANYAARINSDGWRPENDFPSGVDMRGVDLIGVKLSNLNPQKRSKTNWSFACLSNVDAQGCWFSGHFFYATDAANTDFSRADLSYARAIFCTFSKANFRCSNIINARMNKCDFTKVDFSQSRYDTDFSGSDLTGTEWGRDSGFVGEQAPLEQETGPVDLGDAMENFERTGSA